MKLKKKNLKINKNKLALQAEAEKLYLFFLKSYIHDTSKNC